MVVIIIGSSSNRISIKTKTKTITAWTGPSSVMKLVRWDVTLAVSLPVEELAVHFPASAVPDHLNINNSSNSSKASSNKHRKPSSHRQPRAVPSGPSPPSPSRPRTWSTPTTANAASASNRITFGTASSASPARTSTTPRASSIGCGGVARVPFVGMSCRRTIRCTRRRGGSGWRVANLATPSTN